MWISEVIASFIQALNFNHPVVLYYIQYNIRISIKNRKPFMFQQHFLLNQPIDLLCFLANEKLDITFISFSKIWSCSQQPWAYSSLAQILETVWFCPKLKNSPEKPLHISSVWSVYTLVLYSPKFRTNALITKPQKWSKTSKLPQAVTLPPSLHSHSHGILFLSLQHISNTSFS